MVLVRLRAQLHYKQHRGQNLLVLHGEISLENPTVVLLLDVRDSTQNVIPRRVRQLLGFAGGFILLGLPFLFKRRHRHLVSASFLQGH